MSSSIPAELKKINIWYPRDWREWGVEKLSVEEFVEWLSTRPFPECEPEFVHFSEEQNEK